MLRTRASGSGEAFITIVGCDFHPGWQQVAVFDSATGEIRERKLENANGEAERFYRSLPSPARVGFEACGNTQWFEDLLDGFGHEVWIGDAAEIRASYVRKQKTDRRDAAHILKLLIEGRFPRLWRPSRAERDLRQLLIHRHRLVGIGTRVKNGLRLMARASLFHGMTRVYQELLSVRRDANEMYLVPVPAQLVGMDFVEAANVFLPDRTNMKACLLIGFYRGDRVLLKNSARSRPQGRNADYTLIWFLWTAYLGVISATTALPTTRLLTQVAGSPPSRSFHRRGKRPIAALRTRLWPASEWECPGPHLSRA